MRDGASTVDRTEGFNLDLRLTRPDFLLFFSALALVSFSSIFPSNS